MTFAIGLVLSLALLAIVGCAADADSVSTFERPYIWRGAMFMLFYSHAIAFAAPRIAVGNAVFFVLLGQLIAAAAIDISALWGAMVAELHRAAADSASR